MAQQSSGNLHTGMNAPRTGYYRAKTTGEIIQTEEGNHLPPDPRSRESTEWEFVGEQETPDQGVESSAEPVEGMTEANEEETPVRGRTPRPSGRSARGRTTIEEEEVTGTPGAGEQIAEQPGQQGAPVTEKPVVTRRKISQYVVSVDDSTGNITKIEKLDEATGQREEFTREEYAEAYAYASYAAPYYGQYAASLQEPSYNPWGSPVAQAYLKAITDYFRDFTRQA